MICSVAIFLQEPIILLRMIGKELGGTAASIFTQVFGSFFHLSSHTSKHIKYRLC